MDKKISLRLPLQYFAEGEANNTATPAEETPTTPPAEEEKSFTQTDVNNLVARESKSAIEKLLKEAGISADGNHSEKLKAFKEWQDSQKSELERATGTLTTLETEKQQAVEKATLLERKFTAVSKGIPADKADKYIKLAEAYTDENSDFDKALDLALKDFPVAEKGTPGAGGNPPPTPTTKTPLPSGMVSF